MATPAYRPLPAATARQSAAPQGAPQACAPQAHYSLRCFQNTPRQGHNHNSRRDPRPIPTTCDTSDHPTSRIPLALLVDPCDLLRADPRPRTFSPILPDPSPRIPPACQWFERLEEIGTCGTCNCVADIQRSKAMTEEQRKLLQVNHLTEELRPFLRQVTARRTFHIWKSGRVIAKMTTSLLPEVVFHMGGLRGELHCHAMAAAVAPTGAARDTVPVQLQAPASREPSFALAFAWALCALKKAAGLPRPAGKPCIA
eukprot:gene26256-17357_t